MPLTFIEDLSGILGRHFLCPHALSPTPQARSLLVLLAPLLPLHLQATTTFLSTAIEIHLFIHATLVFAHLGQAAVVLDEGRPLPHELAVGFDDVAVLAELHDGKAALAEGADELVAQPHELGGEHHLRPGVPEDQVEEEDQNKQYRGHSHGQVAADEEEAPIESREGRYVGLELQVVNLRGQVGLHLL